MPLSRDSLERQLAEVQKQRDACAARFQQNGLEEAALGKQPAWRSLNATCRQLTRRLGAVSKKEELTAQAAARAAEGSEE